jgi:hypothetical protein
MPLRLLFSALICLALCTTAWAEEFDNDAGDVDFPYDAFVNTDDVYVRSGPGQNYYPVLRLQRGDRISVYRHDPGGWYAIRPPAECFSWVSAEFVEPGEGKMARIKGDRVVARVGSAFSDIRDVIQVRLDEGELVEVLEAKRIGTGPAAQTWYKVSPPAGEFRWVSGQFIASERPEREARKRDAHNNLLIARHAKKHEEELNERSTDRHDKRRDADSDEDDEPRRGPQARQVKFSSGGVDRDSESRGDDDRDRERSSAKRRPTSHRARDEVDRDEPAPERRPPPSQVSRRTPLPQGDVGLMKELEDLDYQLSAEVAKEPAHWNLVPLHERSDALLSRSDTALDRGRVRLVQRKISRFEDIKQRADKIASAQRATDLHNQDAIHASLGGSLGVPMDERFDGVGKLTQIYPAQSGVASYALVDKEGKVKQYVTAAPGVNLRPFIGREVGVQGTLGYMTDAQTSHLTAKRVALMDEGRVLR